MEAPHFEVSVNKEGRHPVLHLRGEIDFATAPNLQDALNETLSTDVEYITLDFQNVTFLDSEGLKVLLQAYQELREHGGKLNVQGCNKFVAKTFEILGVQGLFGIDEEEARSHI